jgi:hypothetical protein
VRQKLALYEYVLTEGPVLRKKAEEVLIKLYVEFPPLNGWLD